MTVGLWILGSIAMVFVCLPAFLEHRKIMRRQRARRDFRHILGAKEWWGKR